MKLFVGLATLAATMAWCAVYAAIYGGDSIPSSTVSTAWLTMLIVGVVVSMWGFIEETRR